MQWRPGKGGEIDKEDAKKEEEENEQKEEAEEVRCWW